MLKLDLNGRWKMKNTLESEWITGTVPGSVYSDLLKAGKIEDPFYRDNEDKTREISRFDFEYGRKFNIGSDLLECDRIILQCDGLDTLAEISINGHRVGEACNMHRFYEFDIKDRLLSGENDIHILFRSPINYIEKKQKEFPLWGSKETIDGFPHIRKAHYMLGWDWGPQLPDMGIWRNISIKGYKRGRLKDVYIVQKHEESKVSLDINVSREDFFVPGGAAEGPEDCRPRRLPVVEVFVKAPDGTLMTKKVYCTEKEGPILVDIENPQLWWPNGYGEQPLYGVKVVLSEDGEALDDKTYKIGLRKISVRREKDKWGESFEFNVNGISIFAMGADYIPEDNLLSRCSKEKTEKLIKDCARANFNCLRVWGGGIYPEDYFFDLCDQYGLMVWQDFLYACAAYNLTEDFADNVKKEAEDNVRRIRHHACLGLWCGNNEMEWAWASWKKIAKDPKLKTDYLKLFEILLRRVVEENDPESFYWPSSPSSGGCFEAPADGKRGDVHYWDVWSPQNPITVSRNVCFRFVSEFGFQSFPERRTIDSFTLPQDRNPFARIMEKHQKNLDHNSWIIHSISNHFKYPGDFDSLLYASQILQAEAIRYGVEHWRRNRGRCMGVLFWQLNDCWPAVSWSSIDYFGRWKALHYSALRFFAPVLLSVLDAGRKAEFHITNETLEKVGGRVEWKLRDHSSGVIKAGSTDIEAVPLHSAKVCEEDFSDEIADAETAGKTYLEYAFITDAGICAGKGTVLFVKPKHFEFLDPRIKVEVVEKTDGFLFEVRAEAYAKFVHLALSDIDCVFSDNYFDLSADEVKTVKLKKADMPGPIDAGQVQKQIVIKSVFSI